MKLTLNGIEDREGWMRAGVALPDYDVQAVRESARRNPTWVHFGPGSISESAIFFVSSSGASRTD